jgi:hypothetical protein
VPGASPRTAPPGWALFIVLLVLLLVIVVTLTTSGSLKGAAAVVPKPIAQQTSQPLPVAAKTTCQGAQVKLFDNWNVFGVSNGGRPPSFSTAGKAYCLGWVGTYHWNNGNGATPGTIALTKLSGTGAYLPPTHATGSSGQGGAKNVNWVVYASPAHPVVLDGTYTCVDSSRVSWSEDQQSHGYGFCEVWVTPAVNSGPTTPTTTTYQCVGQQVTLFDNTNGFLVLNGAKPPTFSTKGLPYCFRQAITYHWNNAKGQRPGTIALQRLSGTGASLPPTPAIPSSGQGGAPNVNWLIDAPSGAPVVLDGVYACIDSSPTTWSQNQQTHGLGFCRVYAVKAIPVQQAPAVKSASTPAVSATAQVTTASAAVGVTLSGGCAGVARSYDRHGNLIGYVRYPGAPAASSKLPLLVDAKGNVQWSGTTPAPFLDHHWSVSVFQAPVKSGGSQNNGHSTSSGGLQYMKDYTGGLSTTGLYDVHGAIAGTGGSCAGSIWLKLVGSPTGTVPWIAGIAAGGVGLVGMLSSFPSSSAASAGAGTGRSRRRTHAVRGGVGGLLAGLGGLVLLIVYSLGAFNGLTVPIVIVVCMILIGVTIGRFGPAHGKP